MGNKEDLERGLEQVANGNIVISMGCSVWLLDNVF